MVVSDDILSIISPEDSLTKYNQIIDINNVGSASTTVQLSYMLELQKLKDIDGTVTFGMGNDMPLSWNITSVDECVVCNGLIAPIIEQEE